MDARLFNTHKKYKRFNFIKGHWFFILGKILKTTSPDLFFE